MNIRLVTRMHSSRMCTVCCSGRLPCHTCSPPTMHNPLPHTPPCQAHPRHAHTPPSQVCPPGMHAPTFGGPLPTVYRHTPVKTEPSHEHSFAGGKNEDLLKIVKRAKYLHCNVSPNVETTQHKGRGEIFRGHCLYRKFYTQ